MSTKDPPLTPFSNPIRPFHLGHNFEPAGQSFIAIAATETISILNCRRSFTSGQSRYRFSLPHCHFSFIRRARRSTRTPDGTNRRLVAIVGIIPISFTIFPATGPPGGRHIPPQPEVGPKDRPQVRQSLIRQSCIETEKNVARIVGMKKLCALFVARTDSRKAGMACEIFLEPFAQGRRPAWILVSESPGSHPSNNSNPDARRNLSRSAALQAE